MKKEYAQAIIDKHELQCLLEDEEYMSLLRESNPTLHAAYMQLKLLADGTIWYPSLPRGPK